MTDVTEAVLGALCRVHDNITDCERDVMGICAALFSKIGNAKSWAEQNGANQQALDAVLTFARELNYTLRNARSDLDGIEEEMNQLHETLANLTR